MEQTKALNALEPFLALSKSATSPRAAADLITRATSAPNTFIFTELLQTPQIQALASSDEFAPYLALLQVFCYGTHSSYTSTPGLPALSDAQQLKLRQLSLLTLANTSADTGRHPSLDYASLQADLALPSRQALEELVISAIYAGLLKAQLNPKASLVQINSVAPLRDVAPTAIGGLLANLQSWAGRCESTLQSLSCQMTQLRADADRRAATAAARRDETKQLVENEKGGHAPIQSLFSRSAAAASTVAAAGSAVSTATPAAAAAANMAAPRKPARMAPPSHNPFSTNNLINFNDAGGSGRGSGSGGGGGSGATDTATANDDLKSVLTVGGSSSLLPPPGGPGAGAGAAGAAHLEVRVGGGVKRGSGVLDDGDDGNK